MAAFEHAVADLIGADVGLVAMSTDSAEHARGTVESLGLTFPVGYGLPMVQTAAALGAFYEERRGILHAAGFLLRPGGIIAALHYSAGPIGRFTVDDVLSLVRFFRR